MKLLMAGLLLTFLTQAAFPHTPPQKKPLRKSDAVERHPAFSFTDKLVFEGKIVRGSIRKPEIDSLLARRVEVSGSPSDPEYGLGFTFPEGHFPVFSCQEWVQARAQGLSSELNTRQRAAESFFVHTCSFLYALRDAKPARQSFIAKPRVGLSNLSLLPAKVLESLSEEGYAGEGQAEIDKASARGMKISDLVAKRKARVLKRTKNSVVLGYDLEMHLTEMGRADFDGDGIEDIFVATAKYAIPGTFRYYDYFILTRRSPSAGFAVKKADWLTLSKNSTALSAGIELKSGQLTKAKITRQEYGDDWPFDIDEGELACANAGSVAVFFIANGKTYALNAWARQSKIDGQPVSTDTYTEMAPHVNMRAVFNKAFAMCKMQGDER